MGGGEDILKNVGDQTVPVGSLKKYNGTGYEERRIKKMMQVWNNMRVSKM